MDEDPALAFAGAAFRDQALRVAGSLAKAAEELGFDEKTIRSWAKGGSRPSRKSVQVTENWLRRRLGDDYQPGAMARLWYPGWDAPVPDGQPSTDPPEISDPDEADPDHRGRKGATATRVGLATAAAFLILIGGVTLNARRRHPNPVDRAPGGAVDCGTSRCIAFRVVDTLVDGRDQGLFVRSCYTDEPCERKALAAVTDTVYGRCRHDGKNVEGISTWVQVPWRFVPGSVAPDGAAIAAATGRSDPTSPDVGYVSARYLEPRDRALELPMCP